MTNNQYPMTKKELQFNLETRTTNFSIDLLKTLTKLPKSDLNKVIVNQIARSGTSIGANYHEANEAGSTKDFKNLIRIVKKECKETYYWLKILKEVSNLQNIELLIKETNELTKIFAAIHRKLLINEN